MEKKLAMIVGNNFEEIEMIATVDVLRRAGLTVDIISLYNDEVLIGAHDIKVESDLLWIDFNLENYDGIIIPGGAGVDKLERPLIESQELTKVIKESYDKKKLVAAICAAPQLLGKAGILENKNITHFPGSDQFLENAKSDLTKPSVIDGNIITGESAGSAIQFSLNIVEYYFGESEKEKLAKQLVMNYR